ncbi:MAG TPA: hypothetical protein ENJ79_09730 [Gammaproteobacteria bacterium]|nr:hypothetical protein [Gammaproteobacteria bacterium]
MHIRAFLFTIATGQNGVRQVSMIRLYVLALIVLPGLFACGTAPVRESGQAPESAADAIQALIDRGEYLAAAQRLLDQARTSPPEQRAAPRLRAAKLLARGEHWEQLHAVLDHLDTSGLNETARTDWRLLRARLDIADGDTAQALERLEQIHNPELLPDRGFRYYQLRAMAYAMRGNPLEAARQLIWLDGLIENPRERLDNQYRIWEQLSTLSDEALEALRTAPPPDPLSGWMELLLVTRQSHGEQAKWRQRLAGWRMRYPGHAAEDALLPDLLQQVQQLAARPRHVAVLLPFTGRAGKSAAAIRDGLLAAWFEQQPEDTRLRFYDTGGNDNQSWAIYQQALADGADFVIGPLLKDHIAQLARSGTLAAPVMALNQIPEATEPGLPLYQFGLAPEDEARQVAQRMFEDGHRQVVALIPDNAWGRRVFDAFAQRYAQLGGEVLEREAYATGSDDYRRPIEQAFNLDDSRGRHRALERLLGKKLHFEPRRRQDVEAVLILGFPRQARQLRPQLRFHHAGDLPVYATSHVFSATFDAGLDRDMDGLMFCDIPWVLDPDKRWEPVRTRIHDIWPNRARQLQRLFALGYDAWQLAPWLRTLDMPGFSSYPGATGILTLDQHKRIHRALEWARFERGLPEPLPRHQQNLSMEGQPHEPRDEPERLPGGGVRLPLFVPPGPETSAP